MDSSKQREVIVRRGEHLAGQAESATGADAHTLPEPGEALDPDDDTPVASETGVATERWLATPAYGSLGAAPEGAASATSTGAALSDAAWLAEPGRGHSDDSALLDAWFADQAHPALVALLRRPAIAAAVAARLDDTDTNVPVRQTEVYPWRCICALSITAADGSRWSGTGWLAGPRTVITAGHCVFLHRHGGWAHTIEVVPGADGDQRPYGASIATSFRSVTGWTRRRHQATNYGAIILPADNALGNLLGHFGFSCLSDHELFGLKLSLAGYPSDRAHATQWYQQRLIEAFTRRSLSYQSGTPGGPSGAPLWHVRDGQRYVVGIYTHGDGHGPAATRITPAVFQNLSAWQREGH